MYLLGTSPPPLTSFLREQYLVCANCSLFVRKVFSGIAIEELHTLYSIILKYKNRYSYYFHQIWYCRLICLLDSIYECCQTYASNCINTVSAYFAIYLVLSYLCGSMKRITLIKKFDFQTMKFVMIPEILSINRFVRVERFPVAFDMATPRYLFKWIWSGFRIYFTFSI